MTASPAIALELIDDPAWMGGVLYLRNLAICLSRLPDAERPELRLLGPASAVDRVAAEIGGGGAARGGLLDRLLSRFVSQRGARPVDLVYPGFGATPPDAITLRWIPDFQHRHLPHLFSEAEIAARDEAIGAIADRPELVVLSSKTAAAGLRAVLPRPSRPPACLAIPIVGRHDGAGRPDTLRKYGLPAEIPLPPKPVLGAQEP